MEIATDYRIQKNKPTVGKTKVIPFKKELLCKIRDFSKENKVSDYVLIFTTISMLLSKMYKSKDFVVGTVANGRVHEAAENMLGMFVNTLPVRVSVDTDQSARQFLNMMNENILSTLSNQNYQFENIAKDLDAANEGRNPFFDCMFVYQNTRYQDYFEGLAKKNPYKTTAAKFSLTFEIEDSGHSMDLFLNYDSSLFKQSTIDRLCKNFFTLLENYLVSNQETISELSALSKEDKNLLLNFDTLSKHGNVIKLIEEQVDKTPDNIALQFGECSLTYSELDNEINKLANYLITKRNVKIEQKIPLLLQRSEKMVIAILGVLKAGAAYVPISPKYPQDRIDYIIDTCESNFVIDDEFMSIEFPDDTHRPEVKINENNLAYIIFTSGTTGKPKGVMVEHGNLSNFVVEVSKMSHSGMAPGIINGAFFEYVFDASIHDLIRPFSMGESVVMLDTDLIYDIDKFINTLNHYKINAMGITPSLASKLDLNRVPSMKFIHCGGEAITTEVIEKYADTNIQINNCYGPTETTILSFVNNDVRDLSIGKPIGGVYPFILDDEKQLLPVGAVGNLFIGGKQVTRGYINQLEETRERYLDNPYGEGFIYDTGDVVRRLENGSYEYYGRKDQQVKIRGFRIELSEVEKQLQAIGKIEQAAVIVDKENLVAYYTSPEAIDSNFITESLNNYLPNYMIPIAYVHIKEIPITINGKLDIKRLPKPQYSKEYHAPETDREKEIAKAICKILELSKVSIDDDFFRMGGNSIAAISLASLIDVQVKDIFEQKTIRNLAKIENKNLEVEKQLFRNESDQILSYAQERLFYIDQLEGGTQAYNVPMEIVLNPTTNLSQLEQAIKKVVNRHEILRTIIKDSYQKVLEEEVTITHEPIDNSEFFSYKFDLTKEIPIKVNLYELVLSINIHHIAFDGWSTNIFLNEIAEVYNNNVLPNLEIQYKDFAKWQRITQNEEYLEEQKSYWVNKLTNYETLNLPTDFSRPSEFDYKGRELIYELRPGLMDDLEVIAKKQATSLFSVTLSAFMILLAAYSNQKDIVVGTPIANRQIKGTKDLIGFFVNTLALRNEVDLDLPIETLIQQNSQQVAEAQKYQDVPFENIVKYLDVESDLSRNPIFQIMFGFQDVSDVMSNSNLYQSINENLNLFSTKFDISVMHREDYIDFTYATSLFKKETILGIAETYENILEQIIVKSGQLISNIELETNILSRTEKAYPQETIDQLFEKVAINYPENKAIIYGTQELTYRELNQKANKFAHTLIDDYGILPGAQIPILLNRSENYVIAILGILKTGACYVPLSVEYPKERIDYILNKIKAPVIITDKFKITSGNTDNPNVEIENSDLAYIIFTSGTTGLPKGVMIEHRGVVNTIYNQIDLYNINETTRAIHFADFVFDASVFELFYTLLAGATTYLVDQEARKDYQLLRQMIVKNGIELATLPPAILSTENLLPLKTLIVAGETTPKEVFEAYDNNDTKIVNAYGPTETTVCATVKIYERDMDARNIGQALNNTTKFVLDSKLHDLPYNALGELYVGGAGLARGYIDDDGKTKASFINHPRFGRIYKTGDIVKRLPTNDLIYIGRNDSQVKLRGFRIELDEIEARMLEQESVLQCVALVKKNNIVVYYTGNLDHSLDNELPTYMVPNQYIKLSTIPLTINGKIDLRKLPEPVFERQEFIAPKTKRELEIAAAFSGLLGLDKVSITDDFYKLGGNSILALKLSNRIDLQVKQILQAKNIQQMAKLEKRSAQLNSYGDIKESSYELSFAQERLWFIDQFEHDLKAYNVPLVLELSPDVKLENLERAIKEIVNRHEVLRTLIIDGRQVIQEKTLYISHDSVEPSEFIEEPFDLSREFPIRVNIYDGQLMISIHHIAFDGWSTEILLTELNDLYLGKKLSSLTNQYKDYSGWQRHEFNGHSLEKQEAFWKDNLKGYEPLNLPSDFERPKEFSYRGADISIKFKSEWQEALETIARKYETSLYTIMLSLLDIMLAQYSYQQDIVVGTPIANRHIKGTEDLIGFFINTLPVRTEVKSDATVKDLILKNKKTIVNIQNNQDIPFEKIVDILNVPQDTSRNPIFQVLFSVQDFAPEKLIKNNLFMGCNEGLVLNSAKYDLSVLVENGGINFNYCTDIYSEYTIQSMIDSYSNLIEQVIEDENREIKNIQLTGKSSIGVKRYYPAKTVVDIFLDQVRKTPDLIAIEYQGKKITYSEFDSLTNQFANYLLENGVEKGDKIPVLLERSEKMSIAIWGILKAGCAYVPISPEFPEERKQYIIEQIESSFLIDEAFKGFEFTNKKVLDYRPELSDLAYIIFTSGTTGNPKGVMIEHSGLSNRIQWMNETYPINETDKVYQKTNFVFDVSVWEQVWALLVGARIVFAKENGHKDPLYLANEIRDKGITVMHFVPSMLDVFLDTLEIYSKDKHSSLDVSSLKYVFCSGEALSVASVERFKQMLPNTKLYNLYGPTEASIDVTAFDCSQPTIEKVLIGKPVANTNCYVLGKSGQLLPEGAIGELALGGIQLARGYINQAELTKEKFVDHSVAGRIYKTGDLVRILHTGEIEYLGRNDFQVKIHGLRIELTEIEKRVLQIEGIQQAIVLKVEDQLVVYYSGSMELSQEMIERTLREKLPDYMIPAYYIFMAEFPLTINGKLDRKALPVPTIKSEEFVEPNNSMEKNLQEIFSDILGIKANDISILTSFFNLGGDSIKAIQLSNRIKQKLDKSLSIKQIFDAKTIKEIAKIIEGLKEVEIINEQGELTGGVKLLPVQQWFFEEYNTAHFNQAFAIQLPEDVNIEKLRAALIDLINYHDALRIVFDNKNQYYSSKVNSVELSFVQNVDDINKLQRSFKLSDKLYRFAIKPDENILIMIGHHLIIDSVSWQIFTIDLKDLYEGKRLPKKQTSYRQWSNEIDDLSKKIDFNDDMKVPIQTYKRGKNYQKTSITVDTETTTKLVESVNNVYNTNINDILLTVLARTLKKVNNSDLTSIKLESHGRAELKDTLNIQRTVGWFTTIYPQLISTDLLKTKSLNRRVKDNGIDYVSKYGIHSKEIPGILFNYLGQIDTGETKEWSIVQTNLGESTNVVFDEDLTINGAVYNKILNLEFSGFIADIELIAQNYKLELESLVEILSKSERTYLTVEDINGLLTQQDLNILQKEQEVEAILPANSLQKGFVYQSLNNTTNDDAYIGSFIFEYEQSINIEAYKKAWKFAQQKYPSLRLSLNSKFGDILQIILKYGTLDFEYIENATIEEVINKERKVPFNLEKGNLFRIRLVKTGEEHFTCVLTNHHAILDGWSNPVLLNFVHEAYRTITQNNRVKVIEDTAYIKSQQYLEETKDLSKDYWNDNLKDVLHPDLAGIFNEDMRNTKIENFDRIEKPSDKIFKISGDSYNNLINFSKKQGITVNIVTQYVWHKVLSIYGGIKETTIGVVNSGRNLPIDGVEDSVGLYIRTLPVQFDHVKDSINNQLQKLQDLNNENMMHGNVNLAELQSNGERLFDTVFIYENYPMPVASDEKDQLRIIKSDGIEKLDYPISIVVFEAAGELSIRVKYAEELFSSTTIDSLFELMAYLIDQITQEVDTFKYVKNIPEFGEASYPTKTITTLFEQQVLLVPKKIALKYGDMQYTFEELNKAANRVAHALINEYGIKVGDKIPLILTKSEKMIIAILGVLKAGAVYVPMSPTFPKERITYIQKQVEASLTIDDKFMAKDFSIHDDNLDIEVRPESLAYIIFTSGTTGRPKGVMVEHRNFICYLGNILASIKNTGTQDIEFGCIAEYVFDIFGTEIFGQLLRGKPINLFTGTPEEFPDFMKTHYVTTLQSTPGKISYLFQDNDKEILGTNLSTILVGGEKMNDSFADRFRSINLINIYGPTEGTVWTSMKRIEKNYSNIGTPFPNYAHFILDEEMRLIPDGAIGELYVGGPQLSRGYYGQPELTNNSFLKNPYNYVGSTEYSRIYKTGDVVRRLLNHEFELIGRNDFQVKIRGFRIELGEIESAMLRVPGIKQVLALALGEPENKYLGVYYKSDEEIKKSIIEEVISQYLTDYMMPSGYQHVEEFPLTINGKIDRRALPEITYDNHLEFISPRNINENNVLLAVCDVLELDPKNVSILESFFNIGGDSIKVIKLISLIESRTGYRPTIKEIFDTKTIDKIARLISPESVNDDFIDKDELSVSKQVFLDIKDQKLSYAQQIYKQTQSNSYSNIKIRFKLKENVNPEQLAEAVIAVVDRQEILRTKLYDDYQIIDKSSLVVSNDKIDTKEYFAHVFNLEKEIPIKVNIYDNEFTCVIDHVAFDGWSTSLFLKEIEAFYDKKDLPDLPYQYKDYSKCQYEFLSSNKKQKQLDYWKKELIDYGGVYLSEKEPNRAVESTGGDIYLHISDKQYKKLQGMIKENNFTMHDILLAVFYLMTAQVSKQEKIAIAIPTLNRNISGVENLIGLFINQFLLQMNISKKMTFRDFVNVLNNKIISAQSNQDVPLAQMMKENNIKLKGNTLYFGIQGFKGEALSHSHLFEGIKEMNQQEQKDAFSDLTLFVWGQNLDFNYSKVLFKEETVQAYTNKYEKILNSVIENSDVILKELY